MSEMYEYCTMDYTKLSLVATGKVLSSVDRYAFVSGKMESREPLRYQKILDRSVIRGLFESMSKDLGLKPTRNF